LIRRIGLRSLVALVIAAAVRVAWAATADDLPPPPALSGRIVYTRADSAQWDLFTADADGGAEYRLTSSEDENRRGEESPRWSAAGDEIAFVSYDRDGLRADLWRVPAAGGTPTPVATQIYRDQAAGDPAWSPDGGALVFSGAREGAGPSRYDLKVWRADAVTTLLDTAAVDERGPDWSPDGAWIAYEGRDAEGGQPDTRQADLFLVRPDGSENRRLVDWPNTTERHPRWSADGRRVAFLSYGFVAGLGRATLYVLDVETGTTTALVHGASGPAAWSPDGRYVVFYNTADEGPGPASADLPPVEVPLQDPQRHGLYLVRVADRALFRLVGAAGGAASPADGYEWGYSPDWWAPQPTPDDTATATQTRTGTLPATATDGPSPSSTATRDLPPTGTSTAEPATLTVSPQPSADPTSPPPDLRLFLPSLRFEDG
jgi:hypothetical protein